MKTTKQDFQDLLSQLAADIEDIKAMLNGAATGTATGAAGKANAISNDVSASNPAVTDYGAICNGSAISNPDLTIAEVKRLLEPIARTCGKLPIRIKFYHSQLLLHIICDLREELNRDNDTRKRKGLPTVEDKIDNSLTLLVSIYDRLNQLEDAMMPNTPQLGQTGRIQSANGKSAKSGIIARLQSSWSGVKRLCSKRPAHWYRNPYILCIIIIYLLYFGLSIFNWQQWHHYRDENTRLRLAADKYRIDSIIIREIYPQADITLSAYGHITESKGVETAIEVFREDINAINSKSQ